MNESSQSTNNRSDNQANFKSNDSNFIPLSFSSPVTPQKSEDNFYPSQHRDFSFYSANRRPNNRTNYRQRFYPGSERKSYENRNTPRNYQNFARKSFNKSQNAHNTSDNQDYFHSSMLEDPWRDLLTNLEKRKIEEKEPEAKDYRTVKSASPENDSSDSLPAPTDNDK